MTQSNTAGDAANQLEVERRARVAESTAKIDSIYDAPDRQKQYGDYVDALRSYYTDDANRQKAIADRNLKFSMARAGLTGGSASADAGKTLSDEYSRGILQAENSAQASLADMMSQDQQSRLNLISLANSGTDVTSAAANAAAAMKSATANAKTTAQAQSLGDIFSNTGALIKKQDDAAKTRKGIFDAYGSYYGNSYSGQ